MKETEYHRIINLYETHLQVKKLSSDGTIKLYLYSVEIFFKFCKKFQNELMLPENWEIGNVGIRELEAFVNHQIDIMNWQRSTLVTCVSGLKSFMNFLAETQKLPSNPIQHYKLPRDLLAISKQRYDITQINKLFQHKIPNSLKAYQQRLLLELIYGLGMSLSKIVRINSIVPELDAGTVRIYFKNSRYNDYPFNQSAIKILKSYLKLIDSIEGDSTFWINQKGRKLNIGQLQNLLKKYFELNNIPAISPNELRDLSVQHFSQEGADVRSMQTLRKFKNLRRLQSINVTNFDHLKNILKQKHIRNKTFKQDN